MLERSRRRGQSSTPAADQSRLDILIAGDMTIADDRAFRVAQEVRHHAAEGRRVGLIQTSRPLSGTRIAPEVQTCVRRGLAEVVDPGTGPAAGILVIHGPSEVGWGERSLTGIRAERAILVIHDRRDYAVPRVRQRLRGSDTLLWAPTNPWLRDAAPAKLPLTPEDWLPPTDHANAPADRTVAGQPAVGWIVAKDAAADSIPSFDALDLFQLRLGRAVVPDDGTRVVGVGHLSLDRLVGLDAFAYFPDETETAFPDTLLRAALSRGKTVLLPEWLQRHFGRGPHYCAPEAAPQVLTKVFAKKRRPRRVGARSNIDGTIRREAERGELSTVAAAPRGPRPLMFVASNGVGVGHVSRLLAIARRLDPKVPVVFVSQAQAVSVIERLGYRAEYLPSASYLGGDFAAWDRWFAFEIERLIDGYDPSLLVYDGNNPSNGLIQAAASRRDCQLAWVRRGLWGNTTTPYFDNARWFDLIIEPGELEGQSDEGVTGRRRAEAQVVPPVRLLDTEELLSRGEAAAGLGLDPARPAVLVQLGAGYDRDIVSLIDELIETLQQVPHLQIAIAEWVNGAQSLNYWPGVKYLRGYPLSQYFRAFDFSIAAAGYNTFHEVISFGLPTIFIPNRHPSMDDQGGRAEHAQALQAAFELPEGDLNDLPQLVALLMDPKAREYLTGNCRRISATNGAADAARMLEELSWMAQ